MSTGFANGDLVYDFPQRTSAFASIGFWISLLLGCYYGKRLVLIELYVFISLKEDVELAHSRKYLRNPPLPSIQMNTMTEAESTS